MTKFYIAAAALILAATTAQAEIICTQHRGCWETGKRILLSSGNNNIRPGMTVINHRSGQKDSGKPVRIQRVIYDNE
jgi:hypothetical protein